MNRIVVLLLLVFHASVCISQQPRLMLPVTSERINYPAFDPSGEYIITQSLGFTELKVWESKSGKLLYNVHELLPDSLKDYDEYGRPISNVLIGYSNDHRLLISAGINKTIVGFNMNTGLSDTVYRAISSTEFLTTKEDMDLQIAVDSVGGYKICNVKTKVCFKIASPPGITNSLTGHYSISPNGKFLLCQEDVFSYGSGSIYVWEVATGHFLYTLAGGRFSIMSSQISKDGKFAILTDGRYNHTLYDLNLNREIANFKSSDRYASFLKDSEEKFACFYSATNSFALNLKTEVLHADLQNGEVVNIKKIRIPICQEGQETPRRILQMQFAGKGKYLFVNFDRCESDSANILIDAGTGKIVYSKAIGPRLRSNACDNNIIENGDKVLFFDNVGKVEVYNIEEKIIEATFQADTSKDLYVRCYSDPGLHYVGLASPNGKIYIADTWKKQITDSLDYQETACAFSPDGKEFLRIRVKDTSLIIYNLKEKRITDSIKLPNYFARFYFSESGRFAGLTQIWKTKDDYYAVIDLEKKKVVLYNRGGSALSFLEKDNKISIQEGEESVNFYSLSTYEYLYSFYYLDQKILTVDRNSRFDGNKEARNSIYFTCGKEIIELDQVKEQLWVPNLAKRIGQGEIINGPKLTDLEICNYTPLVETNRDAVNNYRIIITPKNGGLGEVVISINGIEIHRYKKRELVKSGNGYILNLPEASIKPFLKTGEPNKILVRANTADNSFSSRGSEVLVGNVKPVVSIPNVYAVFIGVSDYKGERLDLQYAAKDATDLGNAFANAAQKLLNQNGAEHVFVYKLNTGTERTGFPDKNTIKYTFSEIGKRAGPNDILVVFFAGHGIMQGEKKQFYFLTADASDISDNGSITNTGISTTELTNWIRPGLIKAQKRILIFDACNSGQAINDFVKMGNQKQNYVVARNDDEGQQIKAIEKISERSGFFILSASASNQSAYEFGRYSQGLLTYAMLKTLKQNPLILENGSFLDVSKWFNASKEMVTDLIKQNNIRQEPQIVSANNFIIGIVDDEVRSKIKLPMEKPMFGKSEFRNLSLKIDNLKLRSLVDKELNTISSRGDAAAIVFNEAFQNSDAFTLSGDYNVEDGKITVNILLVKGETEIVKEFQITGIVDDLRKLSYDITATVLSWLKGKKQ